MCENACQRPYITVEYRNSFSRSALNFVRMCIGSRLVPGSMLYYKNKLICGASKLFINANLASDDLHTNRVCQTVLAALKNHFTDATALYVGSCTMSAVGVVDLIR